MRPLPLRDTCQPCWPPLPSAASSPAAEHRPPPKVGVTEELRQWSKRIALEAPATFFRPQPLPSVQQQL